MEVVYVGNEKTPVVMIDDVLSSVSSLCASAEREACFELDERFAYPGHRAPLPESYSACIKPLLDELLASVFKVPNSHRSRSVPPDSLTQVSK
ncbi:conserved hypothetical protein [gamma proteobacterium NOR5-3]|nr:conserved hypothetical protein [gamma proteobacterium NOR5-3]